MDNDVKILKGMSRADYARVERDSGDLEYTISRATSVQLGFEYSLYTFLIPC